MQVSRASCRLQLRCRQGIDGAAAAAGFLSLTPCAVATPILWTSLLVLSLPPTAKRPIVCTSILLAVLFHKSWQSKGGRHDVMVGRRQLDLVTHFARNETQVQSEGFFLYYYCSYTVWWIIKKTSSPSLFLPKSSPLPLCLSQFSEVHLYGIDLMAKLVEIAPKNVLFH